jgi:hypothetical protein
VYDAESISIYSGFNFVVLVARLLVWFSRNLNGQISQAIEPQAPVQSSEMKAIMTICC